VLLQFGAFWYFLGVLYILLGMSIVCEDYFVASLAALGLKVGLSDDVNGATLMAAGSSLPEVFSSFMALANSDTDNSLGMVRRERHRSSARRAHASPSAAGHHRGVVSVQHPGHHRLERHRGQGHPA